MNTKSVLISAAALVVVSAVAYTQLPGNAQDAMPGMDHSAMSAADAPASTKAYEAAMANMMKNMIPHHQGAIDMAKVALQFAKDPEVLKLAEGVVTAQKAEIAFMKDWLAKNAK